MTKTIRILITAVLLSLIAASPALAEKIGQGLPTQGEPGYSVSLTSDDAVGGYTIGPTLTSFNYNFELGSAFVGVLYDCDSQTYSASTCDTVTALSADTTSSTPYMGKRVWLILGISTAETGSNVSTLVIRGGNQLGRAGGSGSGGDLGETITSTQVTITNTGGTDAVIPSATASAAGVLPASDKSKLDAIQYYYADAYLAANPGSTTFGIEEARSACEAAGGGVVKMWGDGNETIAYSVDEIGEFTLCSLHGDGAGSAGVALVGASQVTFTGVSTQAPFRFVGNGQEMIGIGCYVDSVATDSKGCVFAGLSNDFTMIHNHIISTVDASGDTGWGVEIDDTQKSYIAHNTIAGFRYGLVLDGAINMTVIENNTIRVNYRGIYGVPTLLSNTFKTSSNSIESNGRGIEWADLASSRWYSENDYFEPEAPATEPERLWIEADQAHIYNDSLNMTIVTTGLKCANSGGTLMPVDACYIRTKGIRADRGAEVFVEGEFNTGITLENADARVKIVDTVLASSWVEFNATGGGGGPWQFFDDVSYISSGDCPAEMIEDGGAVYLTKCYDVSDDSTWECSDPDGVTADGRCIDAAEVTQVVTTNPLDDYTAVTCSANDAAIAAASGLYRITSCAAGDTVTVAALGSLDTSAAKVLTIINESGAALTLSASNNTYTIQGGSSQSPDGSTFSVIQTGTSTADVIGTGSGSQVFRVEDYGATGDGTTNDVPAFEAAIAAACAQSGPRIVTAGSGDFRMGEAGDSFYEAAAMLDCDGLVMRGNFVDSRLLAGGDEGQTIFAACDLTGGVATDCDAGSSAFAQKTVVEGWIFEDDDPKAHGGQNTGVYTVATPTGGTPAHGDVMSWPGGTGLLQEYSDNQLVIDADAADWPLATETVTDGTWSAVVSSSDSGDNRIEGTHGITAKYAEDIIIRRNKFVNLSDECIDVQGYSDRALVHDNYLDGCSQVGEGGSGISVDSSHDVVITHNYIIPGDASVGATGAGIKLSTNTARTLENAVLRDNTIFEDQTAGTDQGTIEAGFIMSRNSADILNVTIDGGRIEVDRAGRDAMITSGSGTLELIAKNLKVDGALDFAAGNDVQFVDVIAADSNSTASAFTGIDSWIGGSASSPTANPVITLISDYATLQSLEIDASGGSGVYVTGVEGAQISGIRFPQCGNGGFDCCVRELTTTDYTNVSNIFVAGLTNSTGNPICVGITTGTNCNDNDNNGGTSTPGANSVCDEDSILLVP